MTSVPAVSSARCVARWLADSANLKLVLHQTSSSTMLGSQRRGSTAWGPMASLPCTFPAAVPPPHRQAIHSGMQASVGSAQAQCESCRMSLALTTLSASSSDGRGRGTLQAVQPHRQTRRSLPDDQPPPKAIEVRRVVHQVRPKRRALAPDCSAQDEARPPGLAAPSDPTRCQASPRRRGSCRWWCC